MEVAFRSAGQMVGSFILRLKPVFQYVFYFVMIAYEWYDCVSDAMNVYQYSKGDSLDVSPRNESVYYAFFFSLVVSILCALTSSFGYILMVVGLSTFLRKKQSERNNIFKLGRLIVFLSLFCQICFEESIQSVVLYFYIISCSVSFSFWKISLLVCITLSVIWASHTFYEGAKVWYKKPDSLGRKYPSCFAPCYHSGSSVKMFIVMCVFGMVLGLVLFAVNVTTLVNIIKSSEVDIPNVVAKTRDGQNPAIAISPIKDLVTSNGTLIKKIPCTMLSHGTSHFLGEIGSFNCSSIVFTLSLAELNKKLEYKVHYCYGMNKICKPVKETNITLQYSHGLCSIHSPVFVYFAEPGATTRTNATLTTTKG